MTDIFISKFQPARQPKRPPRGATHRFGIDG
jgi:hypothetical protein